MGITSTKVNARDLTLDLLLFLCVENDPTIGNIPYQI